MSEIVESIIASLRGLPRSEVEHVHKHLNAMRMFDVMDDDEPDDDTSEARRVFRILAEEMQATGLIDMRRVSYSRLRGRRAFAEKAEHLVAFVAEQHGDRRVQDGILRIGMQLLIRWLREYAEIKGTFVVTPGIVAANVHKLPARLDRAFPGYGACGLLHLLIPHP